MSRTVKYLEMLDACPLPHTVEAEDELEWVRVMRAAGWLTAETGSSRDGKLQVTEITLPGRVLMERARRQANPG